MATQSLDRDTEDSDGLRDPSTIVSSHCIVSTQESTLPNLPNELLLHLISYLEWPSLCAFRLTAKRPSNILCKADLGEYHTRLAKQVLQDERAQLRKLEQEHWEEAEAAYLGYHSSSYTSSSLDPDLRAYEQGYSCLAKALPCYLCLRWLPSVTDSPEWEEYSCFSRGMSTRDRNLGAKLAQTRFCIPCGIRTGRYGRATAVKRSIVCYTCQNLFRPMVVKLPKARVEELGLRRFCAECRGKMTQNPPS